MCYQLLTLFDLNLLHNVSLDYILNIGEIKNGKERMGFYSL